MEMNSWCSHACAASLPSAWVMLAAVSLLTVILGVVNNDGRVEACPDVAEVTDTAEAADTAEATDADDCGDVTEE